MIPFILPSVVRRFWKPALIVIMIAGLAFAAHRWIADIRDDAFHAGEAAITAKVRKEVAARDALNRKIEADIGTALDAYARRQAQATVERHGREDAAVKVIERTVYPDCRVSDQVLDALNAVRAEGPRS